MIFSCIFCSLNWYFFLVHLEFNFVCTVVNQFYLLPIMSCYSSTPFKNKPPFPFWVKSILSSQIYLCLSLSTFFWFIGRPFVCSCANAWLLLPWPCSLSSYLVRKVSPPSSSFFFAGGGRSKRYLWPWLSMLILSVFIETSSKNKSGIVLNVYVN